MDDAIQEGLITAEDALNTIPHNPLSALTGNYQLEEKAGQPHNGVGVMTDALRKRYLPYTESLLLSPETSALAEIVPFVQDYRTVDGKSTAYSCENQACQAPVTDLAAFEQGFV